MKCALVIALAVCAVQLVSADDQLPVYTASEIQTIARNIIQGVRKIKNALGGHMNMIDNQHTIKQGFRSYDNFVGTLLAVKPDCVSDDKKTLSVNAIADFKACFPDQATIHDRMEECKKSIVDILDKLKAVDQELLTVSDPVVRSRIIAQADVEIAGGLFVGITHKIFSSMGPVQKCLQDAANNVRKTALENIDSMGTCYSGN